MIDREDAAAAVEVFVHEIRNVIATSERFAALAGETIDVLASCTGAVVVTGLGKSGLMGGKISATMASTVVVNPAAPSAEVFDTIGVGDVFGGHLAARLAVGTALTDAIGDAVAAVSASVGSAGGPAARPARVATLDRRLISS